MTDLTQILEEIRLDEKLTSDRLLPVLYDELRALAARKIASEAPGHTLSATALVHEAWLRIAGQKEEKAWESKQHFYAVAADAMRHILIDSARKKQSQKRGSRQKAVELLDNDAQLADDDEPDQRILLMDDALQQLAREHPDLEQIVKLRFYTGLNYAEIASFLNMSERTARRNFSYARAWLRTHLLENE
ncbi:MAG: ECF-type sigma factor [Verrucomicrobiota bacterium]